MKHRWTALLLCAVMLFALPATAAAEERESGFYQIGTAERVEIVPLKADGEKAEGVVRDVDGSGARSTFYPASCALRVTVSDAVPGMWYLMTVSAGDRVYFADQLTGESTVAFNASFALPELQTELMIRIGSNEPGFVMISVPLSYTPAAAPDASAGESGGTSGGGGASSGGGGTSVGGGDGSSGGGGASSGGGGTSVGGGNGSSGGTETSSGGGGASANTPGPSVATPETPAPDEPCARDGSCPMAAFSDLDADSWYHDGVHFVLEHGIMNGVGEGSFDPDGSTSRAMLVTMLWRLEGQKQSNYAMGFEDVAEGRWYTEAIRWAASEHIMDGYSADRFGTEDSVSREQIAVILWRYAKYKGVALPADSVDLGGFIDLEHISDWARDGVQWAVDTGLLTGVGEAKLSPETNAFRAQVATLIMRFMTRAAA